MASPTKVSSIQKTRLLELDGLRGLAIILVVLNHMRLGPLTELIPQFFQPLVGGFTASGKTGVTILFLLSGFLMGTLYSQVPTYWSFLQKRYTRIFPAFVTMAIALGVIRYFWKELPVYGAVLLVIAAAASGGLLWRLIQKLPQRIGLGKLLFFGFIIFQVLTAVWYVFYLGSVSSAVYYQVWPTWLQSIITTLVNATMTLPFGTYVPQLDGVYWSVIAEVLLYILYPIFCIPLINAIKKNKQPLVTVLLLATYVPFFYGLSQLFSRILGFTILEIHLASYFPIGVAIAHLYKSDYMEKIKVGIQKLPGFVSLCFVLLAIIGQPIMTSFISIPSVLVHLIWLPVTATAFLIILTQTKLTTSFFSHPWLVALGGVSYSLYLTHTIAIEMFVKAGAPTTVSQTLVTAAISLATMAGLTLLLHFLLEKPYFANKVQKESKKAIAVSATKPQRENSFALLRFPLPATLLLSGVVVFCFWLAFRTPVSLTAQSVNHQTAALQNRQLITKQSLSIPFIAAENNLGMLMLNLRPVLDREYAEMNIPKGTDAGTELRATLKQRNADGSENTLSQTTYQTAHIYDAYFFPIGFPIVANSANSSFVLELEHISDHPAKNFFIINDGVAVRSVYFPSKSELLKNPVKGVMHVLQKVFQPFTEPTAFRFALFFLPLLLILGATEFLYKKK